MNKGPSKTTWILMGVSAFFFDFLQWITSAVTLIPFVGQIIGPALGIVISIFAWMTLGLWMKMYDVNILNKSTAIMSIFELIPLLNSLPTFTAIVVKRYLDIKAENALNKIPMGKTMATVGSTAMKRGVGMKDFASKEGRQQLYKDLDIKNTVKSSLKDYSIDKSKNIIKKSENDEYDDIA